VEEEEKAEEKEFLVEGTLWVCKGWSLWVAFQVKWVVNFTNRSPAQKQTKKTKEKKNTNLRDRSKGVGPKGCVHIPVVQRKGGLGWAKTCVFVWGIWGVRLGGFGGDRRKLIQRQKLYQANDNTQTTTETKKRQKEKQ